MGGGAGAATITVDDNGGADYTRIQDAVNAASAGDTIEVRSGTYYENVNVNKQLTLKGVDTGGGKPVVDSVGDIVIGLFADRITFDGFIVRNTQDTGIFVNSNYDVVTHNTVSNNNFGGIWNYGNHNIIKYNTVSNNNIYGIILTGSSNNIITDNTVKENGDYDIIIEPPGVFVGINRGACDNIVSNNIGTGNRLIKYFNDSPINLQGEILSELILCNADNSNLNDITIDGSTTIRNNGLYLYRTDNSNFQNIISSNNGDGIMLHNSDYNIIADSSFSNNGWGIILETGYIINNNFPDSSDNNIFRDNAISSNDNGVYVRYSFNNVFKKNTILNNIWYGIYLAGVDGNIFTENRILNNNHGIYFTDDTGRINSNTIYNNYFSNNNNFYVNPNFQSRSNLWNTIKTHSINIIGGSYLGGNFWANPSGTGFSQTCMDADSDGICDSSYTLDAQNIDYLPLAANNSCGNTPAGQNIDTTPALNLNVKFDAVQSCGDTTAAAYADNQWAPLPGSYNPVQFYDIGTTATYSNYITVKVTYSGVPPGVNENSLRLFHYEGGSWVDVTTALDTASNTITGRVTSLSPFSVAGTVPVSTPTPTPGGGGGRILASSFGAAGFMVLSICLIAISILRFRGKNGL